MQRGHAHSAAIAVSRALCFDRMIELARVGGGVAGDFGWARDGRRESERGLGRLGLPSPAPSTTRRTVGRGMRDEEDAVERLDMEEEEEDVDMDVCPLLLLNLGVLSELPPGIGERAPLEVGVKDMGEGESSSMTVISGSSLYSSPDADSESLRVRSITSSWTLSLAAFSTSFWAAVPEAQAFSSCARRSAACDTRGALE